MRTDHPRGAHATSPRNRMSVVRSVCAGERRRRAEDDGRRAPVPRCWCGRVAGPPHQPMIRWSGVACLQLAGSGHQGDELAAPGAEVLSGRLLASGLGRGRACANPAVRKLLRLAGQLHGEIEIRVGGRSVVTGSPVLGPFSRHGPRQRAGRLGGWGGAEVRGRDGLELSFGFGRREFFARDFPAR